MKKYTLIFISLLFFNTACKEENKNSNENLPLTKEQLKINRIQDHYDKSDSFKVYHKNGKIKSIIKYAPNKLIQSINLFDTTGTLLATDTIENNFLKNKNPEINEFILDLKRKLKYKPVWLDSLKTLPTSQRSK
jgi:antitoxin component YwqK of YwqJK toxin-antitoxin module